MFLGSNLKPQKVPIHLRTTSQCCIVAVTEKATTRSSLRARPGALRPLELPAVVLLRVVVAGEGGAGVGGAGEGGAGVGGAGVAVTRHSLSTRPLTGETTIDQGNLYCSYRPNSDQRILQQTSELNRPTDAHPDMWRHFRHPPTLNQPTCSFLERSHSICIPASPGHHHPVGELPAREAELRRLAVRAVGELDEHLAAPWPRG